MDILKEESPFASVMQSIHASNPNVLLEESDVAVWVYENLGIDLYDNQIDFVEAVADLSVDNLIILSARGSGKTFAVGAGLLYLLDKYPDLRIGVFAPKWGQATRIVKELEPYIKNDKNKFNRKVDTKNLIRTRIPMLNGSSLVCISANEMANIEGEHFHIAVIDEAHLVPTISVSQKIAPMLGSFNIAKTIKIGVAMYDNHFYNSFLSPSYKKIVRDWLQCPLLLRSGSVMIDGKEYPKKALSYMPLLMKQRLFPDHPEFHVSGDSDMDEMDFITQYFVKWVKDKKHFLSEDQVEMLMGDYIPETRGYPNEIYFFGLDFMQGNPAGDDEKLDMTALCIWKLSEGGIKRKVFSKTWKGNPVMQIAEIASIVDPKVGLFPCRAGMADYSGVGSVAVGSMQQQGIPVTGILFGKSENESGKNYKNAMCDNFKFELLNGRVKYPTKEYVVQNQDMHEGLTEWANLDVKQGVGLNKQIEAAKGFHDDVMCGDILAVYVATRSDISTAKTRPTIRISSNSISGFPTLVSRGQYNSPSTTGRYTIKVVR